MTIRHLRIFLAVCRRQSITAAAEELSMTQPAVSIAVRELESFYGARLFDRMNRRIYLTAAGETLRQYADTVLAEFDEAEKVLRGGVSSPCRFGVNVSVGETALPGVLLRLRAELPEPGPEVFVGNTKAIERKLEENGIDFAVLDSPSDRPGLAAVPLCTEDMAVVCAPDFPMPPCVTLAEAAAAPLLLREGGSGSRRCTDAVFQTRGFAVRPMVESTSDLSLLRLAESGLGCAVMPRQLIGEAAARGLLREVTLSDAAFERRYYLVYQKKKYLTPAVRQAIAVWEALAGENGLTGPHRTAGCR